MLLNVFSSEESGTVIALSQEKGQEAAGNFAVMDHKPRSFVEVLKAEASKFAPAMTAASTTVQDSSAEMDTSAQRGEIKQRLDELDKIISKLEDVGDLALADLVAARKAEKETLQRTSSRKQADVTASQVGPGCTGQGCTQSSSSWRGAGGVATASGREGTGLAGGDVALELAQQEVDTWAARLRREQEQVGAVTMPMHGMCPGTPQLWASRFSRSFAARGCQAVQSWLGSVSSDAMGHQLLENADDGLECEVDVLDAQSNSASPVLSPSASSRAAPAFAPFRAAAQRTRRDPYMPPLLRGAVKPGSGEEDSHETQSLGGLAGPRQRRRRQRSAASCHVGAYWPEKRSKTSFDSGSEAVADRTA